MQWQGRCDWRRGCPLTQSVTEQASLSKFGMATSTLYPGTQVYVPADVLNGWQSLAEAPQYLYCLSSEWTPDLKGIWVNPCGFSDNRSSLQILIHWCDRIAGISIPLPLLRAVTCLQFIEGRRDLKGVGSGVFAANASAVY